MKRITLMSLCVVGAFAATHASAQIYQWKDADGKTIISDKPAPVGIDTQKKIETPKSETQAPEQKTLADKDLEFRKRKKESQEKAEKEQQEQAAAASKKESCDNTRRYLSALESGERIASRNDKGERIIMEDAQRAQETAKAKQILQDCPTS